LGGSLIARKVCVMETSENEKVLVPAKLQVFMYGLMKEARRDSFVDFCENWGIDFDVDYPEIVKWFERFGVKF
jgi:hypothetical protein